MSTEQTVTFKRVPEGYYTLGWLVMDNERRDDRWCVTRWNGERHVWVADVATLAAARELIATWKAA